MIFFLLLNVIVPVHASSLKTAELIKVSNVTQLKNLEKQYEIPKEVKEYVENILKKYPQVEMEIDVPNSVQTKSSTGSWSGERIYKGYRLKDWIVKIRNSTGYLNVKTGNTAYEFASKIIVTAAGIALDKIVPFSGTTLSVFVGAPNNAIIPSTGDKAQANISYSATTKFTYVISGKDQLIGARTQQSKLEEIDWFYYCSKNNKKYSKTKTYNKTITTPSFSNPDSKAITGTISGVWMEYPIEYKVGNVSVRLE